MKFYCFFLQRKRDGLVEALEGVKSGIDDKLKKSSLQLLGDSVALDIDQESDWPEPGEEDEEDLDEEDFQDEEEDEDEDEDEEDVGVVKKEEDQNEWSNLASKAVAQYRESQNVKVNWMKLVYGGEKVTKDEKEETIDDLFVVRKQNQKSEDDQEDGFGYAMLPASCSTSTNDWDLEEVRKSIADSFVTGNWTEDDAEEDQLKKEIGSDNEDNDDGEDMDDEEEDGDDDGGGSSKFFRCSGKIGKLKIENRKFSMFFQEKSKKRKNVQKSEHKIQFTIKLRLW